MVTLVRGIKCMSACGQCHGNDCNNPMPVDDSTDEEDDSTDEEEDGNIFENLFNM